MSRNKQRGSDVVIVDQPVDHGAFADAFGLQRKRPDGSKLVREETGTAGGAWRVRVYAAVDQMRDKGQITPAQHEAAQNFARDYERSRLLARYASGGSVMVDHAPGDPVVEIDARARRRVAKAMVAMGKIGTAAVVAVVCEGESLHAYAGRAGYGNGHVVKGILIAALGVLAGVYRS